ncbi:hypothetical protein ACOMHN_052520 [Nucella lapillus]
MADSDSSTGDDRHPQAGDVPEAIWFPFIHDLYPDLLAQTYFLPPLHFSRTPQCVTTIAEETVLVRDNPTSPGPRQHPPFSPTTERVAGTLFVTNPPNLEPVRVQDSDQQDDEAQQRCLKALSQLPEQVMVVLSKLLFLKYLSDHSNPVHAAVIAKLPTIQDPPIPPQVADGEGDVVVIHRQHGVTVGEIKSIGGNDFFRSQAPEDQIQLVVKKVGKAVKQLNNQKIALEYLVSDLPSVRITMTLMLPNITRGQLHSALAADPALLQELCQALSVLTADEAVSQCLCQEDMLQLCVWWATLHTETTAGAMTDHLYLRLVARFCGPCSKVEIPTPSLPRKVLRSQSQAVAEAGLRFSALVLTPTQVGLLNQQPPPRFLYLQGPPGTGKTVSLLLKAAQWARQGCQVVIVSGDNQSRAVTLLTEAQLLAMLGAGARSSIVRHCCHFRHGDFDVDDCVTLLLQCFGPVPVLVVFDEVDSHYRNEFFQWLTKLRDRSPDVTVWSAGLWTLNKDLGILPSWLEVLSVQESLRCPPTVTSELQRSRAIQHQAILPYAEPKLPVATQGPPVEWVPHYRQPSHSQGHPWRCTPCADHVAHIVKTLGVGQKGQPLQFRDCWILYRCDVAPRADDVMVKHLQQHHSLPIQVVTSDPLNDADARELALAECDVITVTHWECVRGLERRVVIALGTEGTDWGLQSLSRCSSSLHLIG